MYSRRFYCGNISACFQERLAHSECCMLNMMRIKVMCNLFLGRCLFFSLCARVCGEHIRCVCIGHVEEAQLQGMVRFHNRDCPLLQAVA